MPRLTLTRNLFHRLFGVTRVSVDGKKVGWWSPSEAEYLERVLNNDPWALSVFLASRDL